MTTEADTTALTYRLPQQRKLVTELPGPRSKEFAARRGRAVAAGVGSSVPVYAVDADGGVKGTVGVDVDLETAQKAARICGINLLAQMKAACDGDLDRVVRVVKLGGFVQVSQDFTDIPKVINGCSDLMVEVFGDAGRHARSAVGVYKLPLGFSVEVDAVVEVA